MGALTGAITAATGVYVLPGTPYLHALQFDRHQLVQVLGVSFTTSTVALGAALMHGGQMGMSWPRRSLVAIAASLAGMRLGQLVRGRVREATFRLWFFLGLLGLGLHLALRGLYMIDFPCLRRGTDGMPNITARDGTRLYYEEVGSGTPIVFVHEYAGDYRSFEAQMRYFSRAHRCVAYSQRGYPPSDVPEQAARYGQDIARDDVMAVMDALKIDKAHVVGHSMGAYTALHVGDRLSRAMHFGRRRRMRLGLDARCQETRSDEGARRRDRQDVRRGGHRVGRGEICRRADAACAEAQGSARPRRIFPQAGRTFRAGSCADHVQSPAQAPDAVGDGGQAQALFRPALGDRRRRGRSLHRRQRVLETHRADGRAVGDPALGPQYSIGRAGHVQRRARRPVRLGASRALACAQAARPRDRSRWKARRTWKRGTMFTSCWARRRRR